MATGKPAAEGTETQEELLKFFRHARRFPPGRRVNLGSPLRSLRRGVRDFFCNTAVLVA